jgi:hypothetical protein
MDSFDGSVEANAGNNGFGNDGNAHGAGDSSGGGLSSSFGSGTTVDLGAVGTGSPAAMQFTGSDAATLGGLAAVGVAAFGTSGLAYGLLITGGTAAMAADPVSTALAHAAHDMSLGLGQAATANPTISMYETAAAPLSLSTAPSDTIYSAQSFAGNT